MVSVGGEICVKCKGRLWCGRKKCPILERIRLSREVEVPWEFVGKGTGFGLVGWKAYPKVRIAPLEQLDRVFYYDPPSWTSLSLEEVVENRVRSVGAWVERKVEEARDPDYQVIEIQDAVMSVKPVDLETSLAKRPSKPRFDPVLEPVGPTAPAKSLSLASDPKIPRALYKVAEDEVRAEEGVMEVYRKFDVYKASQMLALGLLGIEKRFVPTRWAITAVDSMVGERLRREVLKYPELDAFYLFHSSLFDNHFYIIFLPSPWMYEIIEVWGALWAKTRVITQDYEMRRRKRYAGNVGGSYYAARLAVLEKLKDMKRQAGVLILREVREGYYAPVGVWQVRENVRKALREKGEKFESLEEVLARIRLRTPLQELLSRSKILRFFREQKRILNYYP